MVKRTYVVEIEVETGRKKDLPDGASVAIFLGHALHEAQKDELPDFNRDDYRVHDTVTVWRSRKDYLADHVHDALGAQAPKHKTPTGEIPADLINSQGPDDPNASVRRALRD